MADDLTGLSVALTLGRGQLSGCWPTCAVGLPADRCRMPCLDILMAQAVHVAQAFSFALAVIRILQEIGLMRRVSKPVPGCTQAASGTVRC